MSKEKQDSSGFMAGLVFGAIVGGAMALFLGGDEGEEMRKSLSQKGKLIFKNIGLLIDETVDEGVEVIEEGRQEIEKTKDEVQKAVEIVKDEGKKSVRRFFLKAGKKLS